MEYSMVTITTPQFQDWIGKLGFSFLINLFFLIISVALHVSY